jgi:sodium/bile acid cotransporter 7
MKRTFDWFLPGMFLAVVLAWLFPTPGAKGGWLHPEILTKAGIALIFFLHGAALSFAALKAGTLRWPVHLVVQGTTFLLFPLVGILGLMLVGDTVSEDLKLGLFYLCALPSTVSSSVAMTAAARGHVAVAVFNATLSSLLGVVLTPLWMGWMVKTGGEPLPLGKVVLDLLCWLVLPLLLGQCARPWLGGFIARHKAGVHAADRLTILVLVYTSFCDSVQQGVWSGHGGKSVLVAATASLGLFFLVLGIVGAVCDALKFPVGDRIAAVFCGSKKTLASGVPMAQIMFAAHPGLGVVLLPIMLYHPLQLVLCAWLAGRWAKRPAE